MVQHPSNYISIVTLALKVYGVRIIANKFLTFPAKATIDKATRIPDLSL